MNLVPFAVVMLGVVLMTIAGVRWQTRGARESVRRYKSEEHMQDLAQFANEQKRKSHQR